MFFEGAAKGAAKGAANSGGRHSFAPHRSFHGKGAVRGRPTSSAATLSPLSGLFIAKGRSGGGQLRRPPLFRPSQVFSWLWDGQGAANSVGRHSSAPHRSFHSHGPPSGLPWPSIIANLLSNLSPDARSHRCTARWSCRTKSIRLSRCSWPSSSPSPSCLRKRRASDPSPRNSS